MSEDYVETNEDFYDYTELTPENYLHFTTDCAKEVKELSHSLSSLICEYDDKSRVIMISKQEIKELKRRISMAKEEKKEIKREIRTVRRSLFVDISFLNKLNKGIKRNKGGAHLIDYQKRKVK